MASTSASPTETSAAAIARMNRNITCPSGWYQREPAATKASPAAFSITSMDISTNTRFRRTSSPASPSENRIPDSISPSLSGIDGIFSLRSGGSAPAQVIRAHQSRGEQHGSEFDSDQVRPVQRRAYFPRSDHGARAALRAAGQ